MPGRTASAAAAALFLCAAAVPASEPPRPADEYFGPWSGCALILTRDRHREWRFEIGAAQCALAQSPCSTFKIPNALIGLQTGVVSGPGHLKEWDGVVRDRPELNRDHTLATAMRDSVVWYFQSLARDVGEQRMAGWLERLEYGNQDIAGGIDRFWLGSSLSIDAHGQLELLKRLVHGTLPFRPAHQQTVRDMLVQPAPLAGVLHGKTGSCPGEGAPDRPDHGWFIGWVDWSRQPERNPATTWFVVNIRGDGAWGTEARRIALEMLDDVQP